MPRDTSAGGRGQGAAERFYVRIARGFVSNIRDGAHFAWFQNTPFLDGNGGLCMVLISCEDMKSLVSGKKKPRLIKKLESFICSVFYAIL